jgi:hypothetical protein
MNQRNHKPLVHFLGVAYKLTTIAFNLKVLHLQFCSRIKA